MGKVFTEEQIKQYEADGWVSPVDLLTSEQADECRSQLEAWELLRA